MVRAGRAPTPRLRAASLSLPSPDPPPRHRKKVENLARVPHAHTHTHRVTLPDAGVTVAGAGVLAESGPTEASGTPAPDNRRPRSLADTTGDSPVLPLRVPGDTTGVGDGARESTGARSTSTSAGGVGARVIRKGRGRG
jgi:hypothetical protein